MVLDLIYSFHFQFEPGFMFSYVHSHERDISPFYSVNILMLVPGLSEILQVRTKTMTCKSVQDKLYHQNLPLKILSKCRTRKSQKYLFTIIIKKMFNVKVYLTDLKLYLLLLLLFSLILFFLPHNQKVFFTVPPKPRFMLQK